MHSDIRRHFAPIFGACLIAFTLPGPALAQDCPYLRNKEALALEGYLAARLDWLVIELTIDSIAQWQQDYGADWLLSHRFQSARQGRASSKLAAEQAENELESAVFARKEACGDE